MWSTYSREHGTMPILRYSYASRLQDVGNTRNRGDSYRYYGNNPHRNAIIALKFSKGSYK